MSHFHRSGCCSGCGSQACGGGCKTQKVAYIAAASHAPAPAPASVAVQLPALPTPKMPERMTIEMCCDEGNWFCCTLNSTIAMMLIASGEAQLPKISAPAASESEEYSDPFACFSDAQD